MDPARIFAFGAFRLTPQRQLLMREHEVVRIGGRALDVLTALVERPGEVVTKRDLIARAWPSTTVDDANLKVNVAALRRALDDNADAPRFIATVTGRGYRFVAPVETRGPPDASANVSAAPVADEQAPSGAGGTARRPERGAAPAARLHLVEPPPAPPHGLSDGRQAGRPNPFGVEGVLRECEASLPQGAAAAWLDAVLRSAADALAPDGGPKPGRLRRLLVIELDGQDDAWINAAFDRR